MTSCVPQKIAVARTIAVGKFIGALLLPYTTSREPACFSLTSATGFFHTCGKACGEAFKRRPKRRHGSLTPPSNST
jgi:hypothetical protein